MENKNVLNDVKFRNVNGGMVLFPEGVTSGTSKENVIKCPQCQNPISDYILEALLFHNMYCPYCRLLLNVDPEKIKKYFEGKKKD